MIKRIFLFLLLSAVLFGGLFYLKQRQMQQSQAMMAAPRPPAVISSAEVTEERRQPLLESVGSLVAVNGIEVSAEVSGIVSEVLFESGDRVVKGAELIRLDSTVDRAALNALRAERRLAEIEYQRTGDLLRKKAISQSDFDRAKAQFQAATARVEEQEAVVARKTIRAPFGGVLGIRRADLGEYLNPGQAIVGLQALDPIHLDYSLPEQQLGRVAVGQTVRVRLDALPGEQFEGSLSAVDAAVMEGTRSLHLRATLANPEGRLRPGMFARVETLAGEPETVLTVPQTAVAFNSYGDVVMVIESGEGDALTVKPRQVESGPVQAGRVEIRTGLKAGERVVRSGHNKLRPGQPVTIDDSVELDDAKVDRP